MNSFPNAAICALCLVVFSTSIFAQTSQQPVCASLNAANLTYDQNFDTLATSGTTNTSVPTGFGFSETGVNADGKYRGSSGASTGDTYSFGLTTDRAFGTQRTSGTVSTIGGCFVNNTGSPITAITVKYDGELWYLGVTGRVDGLDFQYSTDATSLTDGTWTDVNALDFVTPAPNNTIGPQNGNDPFNRTAAITSAISSLNIANGAKVYIRFLDRLISGTNDGLGIDNFSLTATVPQPGTFSFASSTVSISESSSTAGLTVNRTGGTSGAVTVNYSYTNGTAVGGAGCGSGIDFDNSASSITFANGESSKTISVPICPDIADETDETFTVTLTGATAGGSIGSPAASTVTILNDDLPAIMQFRTAQFKGAEGSNAVITVDRTGDTSSTTTVYFTTSDGNATSGSCSNANVDFEGTAGTLTFSPGETSKDISVPICGDLHTENPAESFGVTLSSPSGGISILGPRSTATVQVLDAATQFMSLTPINVGSNTAGSPYPSAISVSGFTVPISGLRLTLFGVTAPQPENLQFLLVSPDGKKFLFMAGIGGANALQNAAITLDDNALVYLPDDTLVDEGQNYKPSNCASSFTNFPDPMPAGPITDPGCGTAAATFVSAFGNTDPNGNWTLYVQDTGSSSGLQSVSTIGGWGIQLNIVSAAQVSISGRVMSAAGRGIKNALVTIAGGGLVEPKRVKTNQFGMYKIGVTAGTAYVISVTAKGYSFSTSGVPVLVMDDTTGIDFRAEP